MSLKSKVVAEGTAQQCRSSVAKREKAETKIENEKENCEKRSKDRIV
jgi:hypothetical protein